MDSTANWTMLTDLTDFEALLRRDDTFGCAGLPWFEPRCNYMADIVCIKPDADHPCLQGHQMTNMCTASVLLKCRVLNVEPEQHVSDVTYDFLWEKSTPIPPLKGKVLFTNLKECYPSPYPQAAWAIDDQTQIFPLDTEGKGPIRILECFAGGHGGWSMPPTSSQNSRNPDSRLLLLNKIP